MTTAKNKKQSKDRGKTPAVMKIHKINKNKEIKWN